MPSKLYGRTGELWKPDGRIVDGGYAGYHTGLGIRFRTSRGPSRA